MISKAVSSRKVVNAVAYSGFSLRRFNLRLEIPLVGIDKFPWRTRRPSP